MLYEACVQCIVYLGRRRRSLHNALLFSGLFDNGVSNFGHVATGEWKIGGNAGILMNSSLESMLREGLWRV